MQKQQFIATWNPARGVWETDQPNLLCAHLEVYWEVWQQSGITLNGKAYALPTLAQLTGVSASSLLRTPSVTDSTGGAISEKQARERGRMVKIADQAAELAFMNGLPVSPTITESLLGTSTVTNSPISQKYRRDQSPNLGEFAEEIASLDIELMGTPRTSSKNAATEKQIETGAPKSRIEDQVLTDTWGRFGPAIERWAKVIGRPAPPATKPDGKDGAHRLSAEFTEWLMGLPDGWITSVGLSRNEALKACGNGVVPQQAELALRLLLENTTIKGINK